MDHDINGEIVSVLQRLGYNGLSLIGSVSNAFLDEQKQLNEQQGPKKRTFSWDYLNNVGHIVGVATKRVYDKIRAQHVFVLDPSGRLMLYHVINEGRQSKLIDDGKVIRSVPRKHAVDKMLLEAYRLQHPH